MTKRIKIVKSILWFLVGVAAAVAVARFVKGLGPSTALTDTTPWGFWIGFDVLGGVALAAGGFVIAATVYIFHIEKYHPILRPAVLTAFLGYAAVAVGLVFDLGLPWHIWHPVIFWQHHSALFEVAWCVMLYLTVLALEFSPVVLEKSPFHRLLNFVKKLTIPLVILGIMLSTLHQSSLGTLFLIMPFRLHPLWYTPILPILFFVSAVGLGLCMVCVESSLSHWLYNKEAEHELLAGLAKAAAWVLGVYLVIRFGDLAYRGKLGYIFNGSWESILFIFEILISAVIPIALFSMRSMRKSRSGLMVGAFSGVFGFVLNRLNVGGVATISSVNSNYVPSWMEIAISVGIVSGFALAFLFFVEYFRVWETEAYRPGAVDELPEPDPVSDVRLGYPWSPAWRQYSMIFIIAAGLSFAALPKAVTQNAKPRPVPAGSPRLIQAVKMPGTANPWSEFSLIDRAKEKVPAGGKVVNVLLLDADRDGRMVFFPHEAHQRRMGGEDSCAKCHHMNKPLDRATPCYQCHSDMFSATDTFDHNYHVEKMGGNSACIECHTDPGEVKNRQTAKACLDCHQKMPQKEALVSVGNEPVLDEAPGYKDAMHGLCIDCHKKEEKRKPVEYKELSVCGACHRELGPDTVKRLGPYPRESSASRGK